MAGLEGLLLLAQPRSAVPRALAWIWRLPGAGKVSVSARRRGAVYVHAAPGAFGPANDHQALNWLSSAGAAASELL